MTKFGIEGLTKGMAVDLANTILGKFSLSNICRNTYGKKIFSR